MLSDLSAYADRSASPEDLAEQQSILAEYGIHTQIEPTWPTQDRSVVEIWSLVLAVPLGIFLTAFVEQVGSRSADGLVGLLAKLARSRSGEGRIEIGDAAISPIVIIFTGGPVPPVTELESALDQFAAGEEIYYDHIEGLWRVRS